MPMQLPASWKPVLAGELEQPYFRALERFLEAEREREEVFPAPEDVFAALALTPWDRVRVLLLGQDPYHDVGQAHGLCFSVRPGVRPPPSLVNIFKELHADLGTPLAKTGCLIPWARQGVVMLNAVLTVRAHAANSHKGQGWEQFTDAVIRKVNERPDPVVFVLWGGYAKKKRALIDEARHTVIAGPHPSPLSARLWFGTRPFSKINAALEKHGHAPIDWALPAP
jgi:uracil-DNA glycosylase